MRLQQVAAVLQGFGAGYRGQGPQYLAMLEQNKLRKEQQEQQRKNAAIVDSFAAEELLKQGDITGALNLIDNRVNSIQQLGGDASHTQDLGRLIREGNITEAMSDLGQITSRARVVTPDLVPAYARAEAPEEYTLAPGSQRFKGNEVIAENTNQDPDMALKMENAYLTLQKGLVELENMKKAQIEGANDADEKAVSDAFEAKTGIDVVDSLLSDDSYKSVYGNIDQYLTWSSQTRATASAYRDQIVSLLSLENRQKLKGQGTITDNETQMLAQASTILANPAIGDKTARKELRRVRDIFVRAQDRATKNPAAKEALSAPAPQANAVNWNDL